MTARDANGRFTTVMGIPRLLRPREHVVADCRLRDYAPSWVMCTCGQRLRAKDAAAVAVLFAQHRRAVGCASVGMADPIGSRRREVAFA